MTKQNLLGKELHFLWNLGPPENIKDQLNSSLSPPYNIQVPNKSDANFLEYVF